MRYGCNVNLISPTVDFYIHIYTSLAYKCIWTYLICYVFFSAPKWYAMHGEYKIIYPTQYLKFMFLNIANDATIIIVYVCFEVYDVCNIPSDAHTHTHTYSICIFMNMEMSSAKLEHACTIYFYVENSFWLLLFVVNACILRIPYLRKAEEQSFWNVNGSNIFVLFLIWKLIHRLLNWMKIVNHLMG